MTSRSAEDAVVRILMDRAPNWVSYRTLKSTLTSAADADLSATIERLKANGRIMQDEDTRQGLTETVQYYKLAAHEDIPIRHTIKVGDVDVHRLLATGKRVFFPEEFNEAVESLAKHADNLEDRFRKLVLREQRRYWANVVSIFGVFISVLALVLVGLPKITTDPTLPFWEVVELNLGQLLPLAVVLAIFVIVLRLVIR